MTPLKHTVLVRLTFATTSAFPSATQVAVPGGYLDIAGWRLTYDPRSDTPWTVWQPEIDGVRDVWDTYKEYDHALTVVVDHVRANNDSA